MSLLRGLEGPAAATSVMLSLLPPPCVALAEGKGHLGEFLRASGKVPVACTEFFLGETAPGAQLDLAHLAGFSGTCGL